MAAEPKAPKPVEAARPGQRRWLALWVALAVVAVPALIWAISSFSPTRAAMSASQAQPTVTIGGPFELTTQDGTTLTNEDLKGAPFAVFFGFTHCPEVCPTTLWEMSEALKQLGPDAQKLRVLFVSVDPERDDAATLKRYLQSFDQRITGLTGDPATIETVAKSYRVYWKKIPTDDGDYTMDHTASIFLMDAQGQFTGLIAYEEQSATRLQKLRNLIDDTARSG